MLFIPVLFFRHNDDHDCSLLLQYTKYIAITNKISNIVQKTVVHTRADILLPPQCCSSSAITEFIVETIMTNNNNIKCVNKSLFQRGLGHHIIKFYNVFCKKKV